jgi:hypothetical protein
MSKTINCDNCDKRIEIRFDEFAVKRIGRANFFVCLTCFKLPKYYPPYQFTGVILNEPERAERPQNPTESVKEEEA